MPNKFSYSLHYNTIGIELPDSSVGVYATDPDAFNVFSELFNPIIAEYHRIPPEELSHPQPYFGDPDHPDLQLSLNDPQGRIISTRVRVARNLDGFAFSNFIATEVWKYAFLSYLVHIMCMFKIYIRYK